MNKKQALAIIFLVLAIVLSLTSILVNASVDSGNSGGENQENTTSRGIIQLVIERPGIKGEKHEG